MKRRDFIALVAASAGSPYLAERQARALKDTAGEWGVSPLGRGEIQEKEDTNSRVIHIFWA